MDTSNDLNEFVRITQRLDRLYPRLVPMAATEAVNFSKDRFRQQNWVGHRTLPWKKRKGKQICIQRWPDAIGGKTNA